MGGDVVTIRGLNMNRATGVRFVTTGSPVVPILSKSKGTLKFRIPKNISESGRQVKVMWPDRNGPAEVWAPLGFGPSNSEVESPQPPRESNSSSPGTEG